jgi:transposase
MPPEPRRRRAKRGGRWAAGRSRPPVRFLGVDELYLGRRDKFLTKSGPISLDTGEPLWAGRDRKRETLDRFFAEVLPPVRRRTIRAVGVDMWEPFTQTRASCTTNSTSCAMSRRAGRNSARRVFRQSGAARVLLRGKRGLLLHAWGNLERAERHQLRKAHLPKEQLAHLWDYTYEGSA